MTRTEIDIRKTQVGSGVISLVAHQKHEIIGEVKGRIHDDAEYESDYCMELGGQAKLEPKPPFRFLNHSCEPNCALVTWKKRRKKGRKYARLWLQAIRHVQPGEELTIDYAWPAEASIFGARHSCRCCGIRHHQRRMRRVRSGSGELTMQAARYRTPSTQLLPAIAVLAATSLAKRLADARRRCLPCRVGLTPDGSKVIAVTSTGVVKVLAAQTGRPELTLSGQARVGTEIWKY
jgi:hypothetical protein